MDEAAVKETQGDAEAQHHESSETEEQSQPRIQTLVRVLLETGRKHQIRAQLAHIGESSLRQTLHLEVKLRIFL